MKHRLSAIAVLAMAVSALAGCPVGEGPAGEAGNAAATDHDSAAAQIAAGQAYLSAGQPHDAFITFRRATELADGDYDAWLGLAKACAELRDFDTGLRAAARAAQIDPTAAEPALEAGKICLGNRKYDSAADYLTKAVARDGSLVEGWKHLGAVRWYEKSLPAAATDLQRARELAPDDHEIRGMLGKVYNAQGDRAKAVAEYRAALELEPDSTVYLTSLSWLLIADGQSLDEARAAALRADEIDRGSGDALVAAAVVLMEQGHLNDAIDELKACVGEEGLCPLNGDAYVYLADALLRRNRDEDAQVALFAFARGLDGLSIRHANQERLEMLREKLGLANQQ